MATSELERPSIALHEGPPRRESTEVSSARYCATQVFSALASLRLTVVLFALAIFLVFAGTLAQVDHDVWEVVRHSHFRTWVARIDLLSFGRLVQIFYKSFDATALTGLWVPFPGGKMIGTALLLNLFAAHAVRFKIASSGTRLLAGIGVIALGVLLTALVIHSGMDQAVESELSAKFCDLLWQVFRGGLAVAVLAGAYALFFYGGRIRAVEWWGLMALEALLAFAVVWLLANPEARLDNSGIRILWQLLKATGAGIVLLAGCVMVFRKRAGIVLLHGGVALMMLSELSTAMTAHESQMTIPEGSTMNWSQDIRTTELAVTDRSSPDSDHVTVVPQSLLVANVNSGEPIDHADLPFKIRVHRWMANSKLRAPTEGETNAATAGFGTGEVADPLKPVTGVGDDANKVDLAAAYVEFFAKDSGKSLGTYLMSQQFMDDRHIAIDQPIEVDGKKYDVALRFERMYYPFTLTLKDFRFDRYVGTNTPKNYSSQVVLKDPERNVDQEISIWMNNPLRYAGLTFYQSGFDEVTEKATVLQVMKNPGWMAPYVSCMLVLWGMVAHFGTMLVRFLRRRVEEAQLAAASADPLAGTNGHAPARRARRREQAIPVNKWSTFARWFPALVVLIFAGYVVGKARLPESPPSEMQIYEFGKLPLAYQGRVKPYDTLARNTLQILSSRQEVSVIDAKGNVTEKKPAITWLLAAISGADGANDEKVFRIENLELLDTLGLEHRPLFWRYSLNEIMHKEGELDRQIRLADTTPENERTLSQKKVLELKQRFNFYMAVVMSFRHPPLSTSQDEIASSWQRSQELIAQLREAGAPHAVPPTDASGGWTLLMQAELEALRNRVMKEPVNPATIVLSEMLGAYARGDVTTFNKQLSEYRSLLTKYEQSLAANGNQPAGALAKSEILSQRKVDFEVFFNQFSPFYYAEVLYFVAFLLGVLSWVGWTDPLRRGSIWLLWFTFALHTFALVARVYISGRPPITNLYSTAIFIGWAGVLMTLAFEHIYRLGLGNIAASVIGFLTLLVAYNLSLDGDTFIVLQAVLDTQFWLATHVITINLGYAATYVAGLWGIKYLLLAHVFPVLDEDGRHKLLRTLHGTLCFAIFFSFIGTVLGGLWADDSWGRFWGWDPKENGALMIVLWNALVLHARWGALVTGRGLAMLAVAGNIVTTWSYFGVNELGVGLHSYGASESSTAMWLLTFAAVQLVIIGLGAMPQRWFGSMKLARSASTTG